MVYAPRVSPPLKNMLCEGLGGAVAAGSTLAILDEGLLHVIVTSYSCTPYYSLAYTYNFPTKQHSLKGTTTTRKRYHGTSKEEETVQVSRLAGKTS
jgi:hypothetical protein